ncbi:UNVERIFIED_CONTAM: protein PEP-RELATED DEVELOPMENT ARRESTED 1, chloroplastic [Sesamum latifolium]|uniref:Protein PEP-RELATED DEVELOPMENT ARRESTED 1, chloroplastic n=1 Tax=Sesamum latifolium TaxID=2727402 RepID=A0AAW2XYG4_9LAMI
MIFCKRRRNWNGTGEKKWDAAQYEALLKGGEQVTSVLEEMAKLLEDMNMDEASEEVAVQLAAQGVIGKRVDQMESGFMMALDYMIQLAEKDQDDKTMESRSVIPDRKLLARLVLIREEARNMMGGVNFLSKLVALRPGKTVRDMIKSVMQGKDEGADSSDREDGVVGERISGGIAGRASVTGRKPLPVRPGMFLETVSKVLGGIYAGNVSGVTAQHLEWVHQNTLQILQEIAF